MSNQSIKAAFQRFWEHVVSKIDDKADINHTHDVVANATTADTAISAAQDTSGNVIADTYETKSDATSKLDTAKNYTDSEMAELVGSTPVATQIGEAISAIPQTDWNQTDESQSDFLKNKPFGQTTTYIDTLTWDGNTEGLTNFTYNDGSFDYTYYKISDAVPTLEDVADGFIVRSSMTGDEDIDVSSEEIHDNTDHISVGGDSVIIVKKDNATVHGSVNVAEKGVYFVLMSEYDMYTTRMTVNGYTGFPTTTIKQMDNKYLEPFETVGGDTLTWDMDTDGRIIVDEYYIHVSEVVPTFADFGRECSITVFNGETFETIDAASGNISVTSNEDGFIDINGLNVAVVPDDNYVYVNDYIERTYPKAGIYFVHSEGVMSVSELTINGYTGFTTTKLKEECLPEHNHDDLTAHTSNTSNPHNVTASQLGLSSETWTFTLNDGTTVTKNVVVM